MRDEELDLVLYPDPILRKKAAPLRVIDDVVRDRAAQMIDVMYRERGVGLAAPQVGWSVRLFVMNAGPEQEPEHERVFVNPRLLETSDEIDVDEEGCLSIPDVRGRVGRPAVVRIAALDLDGREVEMELGDLPARVFQHELDHLDGLLFISKLIPSDRLFVKKGLRRLEKEYRDRRKREGA